MLSPEPDDVVTELDIPDGWLAVEAVYGGYVAHLLNDAARAAHPGLSAVSSTVEFLGSVRPGSAAVRTRTVRAGGSSATVSVVLEQGHARVVGLARLVDVAPSGGLGRMLGPAPMSPDACVVPEVPYGRLTYEQHVELRLTPERLHPDSDTVGWVRLTGGTRRMSAFLAAPLLLDSLPSGLYGLDAPPRNMPTVEFTTHAAPVDIDAGGWHLARLRSLWTGEDTVIDQATLIDVGGRVVATATQTRRVVRA